jgi:hypothetical protein
VVADRHRLRALKMGVAGHRRRRFRLGALEDHPRERRERNLRLGAGIGDVETERSRDLVVARPPRMDLEADVAELPLDRAVHVLVRRLQLLDRRELCGNFRELVVVEDPGGVQAVRVHECRLEVVRQQLGVVGAQERPDLGRERRLDAARPERHSGRPSFASIARESAMSLICTASCPMRSRAVNAVELRSMLRRSGS